MPRKTKYYDLDAESAVDMAAAQKAADEARRGCQSLLDALIEFHGQPPPDVKVRRSTAWRNGMIAPDRAGNLKSNMMWASDQ